MIAVAPHQDQIDQVMGRKRGSNLVLNKNNNKKRKRFTAASKDSGDDDGSDEDYVFSEDEFDGDGDGDDDDLKGFFPSSEDDFISEGEDNLKSHRAKKKRTLRSNPRNASLDNNNRKETRVRQPVKQTQVLEDDDVDYDDEEDDEGDEEFQPNEIDFVDEDEEEFRVDTTSSRHVAKKKRVSHQNVTRKIREPKRSSRLKKKPMKKKLARRKSASSDEDDDDFDLNDEYMPVHERSRNKSRRRNTRQFEDLDSDVALSGPSETEYTLSDEEKELLREANKFIGCSTTSRRTSLLLNRELHVGGSSNCQLHRTKGKEKVSNLQEDKGKQVCGICFSEEGKGIVRGTLSCCNHYFCFACIVEWSKVESRCPLCKQRFVTISKPARQNLVVDLRNVVIQVPTRDQVYQPSEEELRGYLDPYDGVVCIECQLGGDDSLMLLCDICDSPAHTYCVGLGREVPEGNWYCKCCRVSDIGSSNVQQVQNPSHGTSNSSSAPLRVIVEDSSYPTPQFSMPTSDPSSRILPSPRYPPLDDDFQLASSPSLGVATLSGRRRIQRHVRNIISSNWLSQLPEMPTRTNDGNVKCADYENELIRKQDTETPPPVSNQVQSAVFDFWAQDANPCPLLERDHPDSTKLGDLYAELGRKDSFLGLQQPGGYTEVEPRTSILACQQLHSCSSNSYSEADPQK